MKTFARIALALGLVSLIASPTRGQHGTLSTNPQVRRELKVSNKQAKKLDILAQENWIKHQIELKKIFHPPEVEREGPNDEDGLLKAPEPPKSMAEYDEPVRKLRESSKADFRKGLAEILDPAQLKRLDQIELQQQVPEAFTTPQVQEALKLTEEQTSKIKGLIHDFDKMSADITTADPDNLHKGRDWIERLRAEEIKNVFAVLTDDQPQAWKEMTGKPFEFKVERRRPN